MSGTQHAAGGLEAARFAPWSRRTDTSPICRQLWPAFLLTAACTGQITGDGFTPTAESEIEEAGSAGSPTPSTGSAGTPNTGVGRAGAASPVTNAGSGQAGRTPAAPRGGAGGTGGKPAAVGGAGGAAGAADSGENTPDAGAGDAGEPTPDAGGDGEITPGGVRWIGRVDDRNPEAVRFSWAGAGLKAVVQGATIAVRLESQGDDVYYQPVIDGEAGDRIRVAVGEQVVTLASGLSEDEHQVELYRDTEGDGPVSVFLGFEEGTVVGAPAETDRFIEVVGDSISVGYGSMKTERHGSNAGPGCSGDHSSSSWFQTYGAVAARELDAELSTIARSGFGMVRGYGQNTAVMPPLFDDTIAGSSSLRWAFERIPAAVIINLGTNDWNGGDPGTPFETAYINFVTQVRGHYPDTLILLTIGPTLDGGPKGQVEARLERVVKARAADGDSKVEIIDIGIQTTEVTGCGWHPSAAEHMRVGKVLAEELRARFSW